ncbi:MAG: lysophospholipid acyltransferase family protein [Streptosporangiaceae bacterium]
MTPRRDRGEERLSPIGVRYTLPSARNSAMGRPMCWCLVHAGWSISVYGAEHIPAKGAAIVAGNHTGVLDGPLLYGVCPRPVHLVTKREVFVGPVGPILRWAGHVPIERFRAVADRRALATSLGLLADGRLLGTYPEGTRGQGDFAEIKGGLAWLALRSGAPILPLVCFGVRRPAGSVSKPAPLRDHVDAVFGPLFSIEAPEPWGPYLPRRVVAKASEEIRTHLVDHLTYAIELTGRSLPGSPPQVKD